MRPSVQWGQIKTRELSIYLQTLTPKSVEPKEGQFNMWRKKGAVMEYDVNNTQGEKLYLTPSPQLSLLHPPANPPSLVCLREYKMCVKNSPMYVLGRVKAKQSYVRSWEGES